MAETDQRTHHRSLLHRLRHVRRNKYEFCIIAINKIGEGEPGPKSQTVLAKDPWEKPGKPVALEISKTANSSVSLEWKAPKNDGGAEIFSYSIEYHAEGGSTWVQANKDHMPATYYTGKGLKETLYEFRVAPKNRAGIVPFCQPTMPTKSVEPVGK